MLLLDDFWKHPENVNQDWKGNSLLQSSFYDFMKEHHFLVGNAPRKEKDAREKTSGLVDIGLITQNRKLSQVGKKLLELSKNNNFTADNILSIPQDSYIYFMQMLKTYNEFEGEYVRPYFVLLFFRILWVSAKKPRAFVFGGSAFVRSRGFRVGRRPVFSRNRPSARVFVYGVGAFRSPTSLGIEK